MALGEAIGSALLHSAIETDPSEVHRGFVNARSKAMGIALDSRDAGEQQVTSR